ncbi:unnamed protein product, partial [Heterosigma akashiwo]
MGRSPGCCSRPGPTVTHGTTFLLELHPFIRPRGSAMARSSGCCSRPGPTVTHGTMMEVHPCTWLSREATLPSLSCLDERYRNTTVCSIVVVVMATDWGQSLVQGPPGSTHTPDMAS